MATSTTKVASQLADGQPRASSAAVAQAATVMTACNAPGTLALTLKDGKLLDSQGRTGYIASNFQFQFDNPPQAGAIFTGGFSVCGNGSLALGGSTVFYSCSSGSFSNLYDRNFAAQCVPVNIGIVTLTNC